MLKSTGVFRTFSNKAIRVRESDPGAVYDQKDAITLYCVLPGNLTSAQFLASSSVSLYSFQNL